MKKILLLLIAAASLMILKTSAQSVITVSGDITTNTNWTNNNIYLLSGFVYVTNNAELTIQEGTIIKGDKASKGSLIITRGSKIWANGTQSQPIVFTSNEPAGLRSYGDWGGIIICGNAPINDPAGEKVIEGGVDAVKGLYGGTNPTDNSGILRYVRIEFPGIAFMPNNEINGLTFGGVGSSTIVDYVMVSYSGDDSFECFGGTVNLRHLIGFRALDDDFDTDFGFSGKCQYLVSLRDSNIADISGSNGFESDNDGTGSLNNPITHPIYSNVTIVGPMINSGTTINSLYKRGAHLRRSVKTSIFNSAVSGFPTGLLVDGANCEANATTDALQYRNNTIAGCTTPLEVASGSTWDITTWFNQPSFANSILPNSTDLQLANPYDYDNPSFMPMVGSPLLGNADFSSSYLADPFFEITSYTGAFGTIDWTADWTNFDCQNTVYIVTGIEENSTYTNVNIYPNPATANSSVSFTSSKNSFNRINIVDTRGKIVEEVFAGQMNAGQQNVKFNAENLSPGFYILNIAGEQGESNHRFIVK
ncbi:MAG TPA: T9SS type A sorting domain-containing protein [Bacteroidia bacterium]|nr:T9SS type A sorting domain-containing protein [Bacteroidia bacterium]HNS11216.1 T9SS type A sorting domain-containing protein [Bacteroidia bacterium]